MEEIHKNYDAVFKDAMTLFKDKTLDFLGLHGIAPITEPLSTEIVKVEVKSEFLDLTFGLQDGRGLHLEEEVNLSRDDMLRFGSYHLELSRVYNREFMTVIFVKESTTFKESAALINEIKAEDNLKRKIIALSIVLASKVVDKVVLKKIIEELKRMGNVIIDVIYEDGKKDGIVIGKADTARKMLADKLDPLDIIKYTGIDAEQLRIIRDSMYAEVV